MSGGHVRKRGKTSWELRYRAAGRTVTKTYRGTKTDAEKELRRLLGLVDTGQHASSGSMTVGQWLQKWLSFIEEEKAGQSADRYRWLVEAYIAPRIGELRLDKLAPAAISDFYSTVKGKTGKPLGARTRQQIHSCLSGALKRAKKLRLIAFNPATDCSDQLPRHDREKMVTLSIEQSRQLLDTASGTQLYRPVLIALSSGARRGECLGLRWESVDFDKGIVSIVEQMEQRRGQAVQVKAPKGEKVRTVTLAPVHVEMFRRLKIEQAERLLSNGVRQTPDHLVCALPDGRPLKPTDLSTNFPRFIRRIPGFPAVSFHDLRHTHATIGLAAGIPAKVMQERLGHSSITMTLDLYSHVTPNMQEQAAAKFDEAFR